jgi:hypothetical protein
MKWILSYKLFENELNRYGYVGKIIDIDKNELMECITKIRDFFAHLFSIPGGTNDIIEFTSYKNGNTSTNHDYAYAAQFSDQLIGHNAEEYEYDNIIGIITKCLFKDYNVPVNHCLRLLKINNTFDANGYSVVFTDSVFLTNFSKKASVVKVPDSKEKVLVAILCYYICHLETMGDNVAYSPSINYKAPIFKDLLKNYCEYILKYIREGGDIFSKQMSEDEAYKVTYETIIHSSERYELLDRMKRLYPEFYNKLTSFGNLEEIDKAASMGDMGFNEGISNKKDTILKNWTDQTSKSHVSSYYFDVLFKKIGFKASHTTINTNKGKVEGVTIDFDLMDVGIFKNLTTSLTGDKFTFFAFKTKNGTYLRKMELGFTNKNNFNGMVITESPSFNGVLTKVFVEQKTSLDTFKMIMNDIKYFFKNKTTDYICDNIVTSDEDIKAPFRNIMVEYCDLILKTIKTKADVDNFSDEELWKIIIKNVITDTNALVYLRNIKDEYPQYYKMFKDTIPGSMNTDHLLDMGFGDDI